MVHYGLLGSIAMIVSDSPDSLRCCVFCGSQFGTRPSYREAAVASARELVAQGFDVVYGGGHVGLMGVVADTTLAAGGEVIGIIPTALDEREVSHHGLTELHLVNSMGERKDLMAKLSHGYLVLPGGIGTADELFEVMTATQLGFDPKPIGLYNVDGYFDGLIAMLDRMNAEGFLGIPWRQLVFEASFIAPIVRHLREAADDASV